MAELDRASCLYREFEVYYERHAPGHDWNATHPEMDGFTITAATKEAVMAEVDDWWDEREETTNG